MRNAATNAFLHGLSIGCLVAGGVAAAGAVLAVTFLPAQPSSPSAARPSRRGAFAGVYAGREVIAGTGPGTT